MLSYGANIAVSARHCSPVRPSTKWNGYRATNYRKLSLGANRRGPLFIKHFCRRLSKYWRYFLYFCHTHNLKKKRLCLDISNLSYKNVTIFNRITLWWIMNTNKTEIPNETHCTNLTRKLLCMAVLLWQARRAIKKNRPAVEQKKSGLWSNDRRNSRRKSGIVNK